MRLCLVSEGDPTRDPEARALARSLRAAGAPAEVVALAARGGFPLQITVAADPPPGLVGRLRRRLTRAESARRRRLVEAAAAIGADVFQPIRPRDLPAAVAAAEASGGLVLGRPGWEIPRHLDLVRAAPYRPELSTSPAGAGLAHHQAGWAPPTDSLRPGRHRGTTVGVVHRPTPTTPGRYLAAALERAGVEVIPMGATLDWSRVPDHAAGVVITESPYPPVEIVGEPREVPVAFWVHHGEHHLDANLRLARRYRASTVLLAHSWHLAHRFGVPVHRFPFGIPVELFPSEPVPFDERRWDVAMVATGTHLGGGRYDRRARLVAELEDAFGERGAFPRDKIPPEEMARLYADARVVPNEGGTRHHPITMRVFEAIGAGALLLTDDLPGTDLLFEPGDHYQVITEPIADQVRGLLDDPTTAETAAAAHAHGRARHTTDHRVDELLAILDATPRRPAPPQPTPSGGVAGLVDADLDVSRVVAHGVDLEGEIPELVVWSLDDVTDRLRPGGYDAIALGALPDDLPGVVAAAKRFVYGTADVLDPVRRALGGREHRIEDHGEVFRVDLGCTEGYRARVEESTG